ncbi:unnamed protein product [Thlaspi arvense]|uniref:BURP domain-containing protein n=1 Tax=Thlaspi arvense TaxID=13288 RepID=A0AAU9RWG4_THLAR|nr:unnamed protein product [Thlaspi arvense]
MLVVGAAVVLVVRVLPSSLIVVRRQEHECRRGFQGSRSKRWRARQRSQCPSWGKRCVRLRRPQEKTRIRRSTRTLPIHLPIRCRRNQLHDNPNVALFFLEKDLTQRRKLTLHFTRTANTASFLPRQEAEKIPFSSNKFPDILDHFSVKPNSVAAKTMKQTIKECEEPGIEGEEKYCATSLESMIDFSTSGNGKNHIAISTEAKETPAQKYSIVGVKKMGNSEAVVCHKQNYPYAVFYCHKTYTTKAYLVSMVGEDGTKVKAAAVCHTDTSKWNPKHLAFLVLKVKSGTVPICHFLPEDHVVWVSN